MAELGCEGKKVGLQSIKDAIDEVDYQTVTIAGQKFMYCGIKMKNGFVVVGDPATCADPANWRDEIGKKISFDNTFEGIGKLEAYARMSAGEL